MKVFNSNDKDKFVVCATYWTYYMDLSNKSNKLRDWTGVFHVKVIISKALKLYQRIQ